MNPECHTQPKLPVRVIWSACHVGPPDEAHMCRVIDRAAAEGVHGVELAGRAIDHYVAYRDIPALAGAANTVTLPAQQRFMRTISERARARGLRLGVWHHEIYGPRDLLDRIPALRAADGLVDLDQPQLYRFISAKTREFFDLFPQVDELVLTLTETHIPVFRRPFCSIPVPERVRRILDALLEVTDPLGKTLVIRPFSAVREDELHVREAVQGLPPNALAMMYKTEPFDWHPFLPDEPLIGSLPGYEIRAETDAGAEYYGQGVFPCSYTGHLKRRLTAALEKGATTAVIRVDRGAHHPALDTPINEGNVIAPTRWLLGRAATMEDGWRDWCRERHGGDAPQLLPVLERTFDVMGRTLYIDRQSFTHHLFPSFEQAKHVQAFGLLEEDIPLDHMHYNWAMLPERRTLTHEGVLEEKERALADARALIPLAAAALGGLPDAARDEILAALGRLPVLAEACLAFCRLSIAHVEEMWGRASRCTESFATEAARLIELAARIDREEGSGLWMNMTDSMRTNVSDLETERLAEIPLRRALDGDPGITDYILCGFASEGHRLAKILHSGRTPWFHERRMRETGLGPDEAVTYRLEGRACPGHSVAVTLGNNGPDRLSGVVRIGATEHPVALPPTDGLARILLPAPDSNDGVPVTIWSASPRPIAIAQIELRECLDRLGAGLV
jgi:hypothetical protein